MNVLGEALSPCAGGAELVDGGVMTLSELEPLPAGENAHVQRGIASRDVTVGLFGVGLGVLRGRHPGHQQRCGDGQNGGTPGMGT